VWVVVFLLISQEGICSFGDCETGRRSRPEMSPSLVGAGVSGGLGEDVEPPLASWGEMDKEGSLDVGNWTEISRTR